MEAMLSQKKFDTWREATSFCAELEELELNHTIYSLPDNLFVVVWARIANVRN